jgi:hypothetical protein
LNMAFRYGNKTASFVRYFKSALYDASKLNYLRAGEGTTTVWSPNGSEDVYKPTDESYFIFTLLEDDTYMVDWADKSSYLTGIKIPITYNGKAVTKIADRAFMTADGVNNEALFSVTIPEGITIIGAEAFAGCNILGALSSFNLPDSLTTIGEGAFKGCANMTTIIIPNNVSTVGSEAFWVCDRLIIYCRASSQPSGWASDWNTDSRPVVWGYNPTSDEYLTFTELADGTYSVKATDVSNLPSKVCIPFAYNGKAVTQIEEDAFRNCNTITTVVIPNSITSIGADAFNRCTNLTTINLPNAVTEILSGAFFGCTALASIIIPSSVTTIGDDAFFNCSALSIYCKASSQPSGWSSYWNSSDRPVTWGYTG